jgi:hypothetical protein
LASGEEEPDEIVLKKQSATAAPSAIPSQPPPEQDPENDDDEDEDDDVDPMRRQAEAFDRTLHRSLRMSEASLKKRSRQMAMEFAVQHGLDDPSEAPT